MRVFRLIIGIVALFQSYFQKDLTLGIIAAFLLLTAIANAGCCGSNRCKINSNKFKAKEKNSAERTI